MSMWAIILIKSVVVIVGLLTVFAGTMILERKMLGWFQMRLGPNRTGPWGLFQPVADGIKLFLKEDIIPADADKFIYMLAPVFTLFISLMAFSVVPIGPPITIGGMEIPLSIIDANAGILVFLAIGSLGVYGFTLGGWASQSKYALLGSLRSTAQMISYELSMGISLVGVLILAGTTRLPEIVAAQSPIPFIVPQFIGFVVFFTSAVAEVARVPFDLPEADTELVSGYHTEYTGMRFATFMVAEYINVMTVSCIITLLYLGGWNGWGFLPPVVWFVMKAAALIFVFVWMRATLPRLRYDRLMNLGWKVMLPLAFLNLVITAILVAL